MEIPRVFISYSHDDQQHKLWVNRLAFTLRQRGVNIILDQWDLRLGDDLAKFMEYSISGSDRVLVICTDIYISKANEGKGGVGYEKMVVTSELLQNLDTNKFIPLVRKVSSDNKLPTCLGTRLYIDMSDDNHFQQRIEELLREIFNTSKLKKPKLGINQEGPSASFTFSRSI